MESTNSCSSRDNGAQQEGLFAPERVGRGAGDEIRDRREHEAHDDAREEQPRRLLRAARQGQREQHAEQRAHERRAHEAEAGDDVRRRRVHDVAAQRGPREHEDDAQHRAGRRPEQVRIGERVAKEPLRRRARQTQQRAREPGAERPRGTDVQDDERALPALPRPPPRAQGPAVAAGREAARRRGRGCWPPGQGTSRRRRRRRRLAINEAFEDRDEAIGEDGRRLARHGARANEQLVARAREPAGLVRAERVERRPAGALGHLREARLHGHDDVGLEPHHVLGVQLRERPELGRQGVAQTEAHERLADERARTRAVRGRVDLEVDALAAQARGNAGRGRERLTLDLRRDARRLGGDPEHLRQDLQRALDVRVVPGLERDHLQPQAFEPIGDPR